MNPTAIQILRAALERIGAVEIRRHEEGGDTCRRCTWPLDACQADSRCSGGQARAALEAAAKAPSLKEQKLERGSFAEAIYIAVDCDAATLVRVSDAVDAYQRGETKEAKAPCPECAGKGRKLWRNDVVGHALYGTCDKCNGTGRAP